MEKPALIQGCKVGLVAPAGPIDEKKLQIAIENVERLGFVAVPAKGILNKYGYLAGDDKSRAEQINSMFADKEIKAIVAVRGGFGCAKILDLIDYEIIKNNPKPLCGYSDLTALLIAIYLKTGIVTYHSEMFGIQGSSYSQKCFCDMLCSVYKNKTIPMPSKSVCKKHKFNINPQTIVEGVGQGILVGGNLTLLLSLIGTEYDFNYDGKLLFFEEINEPPYKIDRMLTQLQMCHKLDSLSGVIIGVNEGCDAKENSLSLDEVIQNHFGNRSYPVVKDFPFGHIPIRCTLPIGAMAKLTLKTGKKAHLLVK